MIRAVLRLALDEGASGGDRFEVGTSIDASSDSCGAMFLWEHLVAELFKEAAENYFDQLPDPTTIQLPEHQSFTTQEIVAMPIGAGGRFGKRLSKRDGCLRKPGLIKRSNRRETLATPPSRIDSFRKFTSIR